MIPSSFCTRTVWLTQQMMAELYGTTKQNISLHILNIYEEEELSRESTVKDFLTVRNEVKNYHFYSERPRSSQ